MINTELVRILSCSLGSVVSIGYSVDLRKCTAVYRIYIRPCLARKHGYSFFISKRSCIALFSCISQNVRTFGQSTKMSSVAYLQVGERRVYDVGGTGGCKACNQTTCVLAKNKWNNNIFHCTYIERGGCTSSLVREISTLLFKPCTPPPLPTIVGFTFFFCRFEQSKSCFHFVFL